MARGVNKVILLGNLGKDPESRFTPSGTPVTTFSLAVNRNVKEGDGWKEQTEWVRCVAWERQAETIGQYVKKGNQLYIEGRLQTREWTDKDNIKRYTTEVIVQDFTLIGSKGQNAGSGDDQDWTAPSTNSSSPKRSNSYQDAEEMEPEDIPF
jgi:single-strand DNA-binding protein